MNINDRLGRLEHSIIGPEITFSESCKRGSTIAEWCHALAKLPDMAKARQYLSGVITGFENDTDDELREFLASVPDDYSPAIPPGAVPGDQTKEESPLPPAPTPTTWN